jgi:hypothetical protein
VYQKTLLHKLLKRIAKITEVVRFGTHWYGTWYGATLGVPYVPHPLRGGTVVRSMGGTLNGGSR